jgi:hypothetical protein
MDDFQILLACTLSPDFVFVSWVLKTLLYPELRLQIQLLNTKDQLISKCIFGVFNSPKKHNENNSTWGTISSRKVKLFVHFWGELKIPKRPFEINWPLSGMNFVASVDVSSNWNLEWKFEDRIGTGCTKNVKRSRANLFLVF